MKEQVYEVRALKISNEVDSQGKKGLVPGKLIATIKHPGMIAPGQIIKVKGRNRRVRCIDLKDGGKRIVVVEN